MASISNEEIKKILTPEEYKEFDKWMEGQTVPSHDAVYEWDFKRWLDWKRRGAPGLIWD